MPHSCLCFLCSCAGLVELSQQQTSPVQLQLGQPYNPFSGFRQLPAVHQTHGTSPTMAPAAQSQQHAGQSTQGVGAMSTLPSPHAAHSHGETCCIIDCVFCGHTACMCMQVVYMLLSLHGVHQTVLCSWHVAGTRRSALAFAISLLML